MFKAISWRRIVPIIGISLLAAGLLGFVGAQKSSAHPSYHSQPKFYLKLDGVTGDSTDPGHSGEIELNSYRIMEDESTTSSTNPDLNGLGDNNLRFLADTSNASPILFTKAQAGDVIANGTLSVRKPGSDTDYLTMKMTNLVLTSFQNNANDKANPTDEVVMKYATIQITTNDNGMVHGGWDFKKKHQF